MQDIYLAPNNTGKSGPNMSPLERCFRKTSRPQIDVTWSFVEIGEFSPQMSWDFCWWGAPRAGLLHATYFPWEIRYVYFLYILQTSLSSFLIFISKSLWHDCLTCTHCSLVVHDLCPCGCFWQSDLSRESPLAHWQRDSHWHLTQHWHQIALPFVPPSLL